MPETLIASSNDLTLDELLANLSANPKVDGIALFGSRPSNVANSLSDYDLLIMVDEPPVRIFQLQTYIGPVMADVAFVETEVADRILALEHPVSATSSEGYLIGWLELAQVVYDRTGRFTRVQHKLKTGNWRQVATESDMYADWFWLNFELRQLKRMVASQDPAYQITVDIHLMINLSQLWRVYYRYHSLHWRGVKEAARYLMAHDPNYLGLYRSCLNEPDRARKLALFERLVEQTLKPAASLWPAGSTAVYLKTPSEQPRQIESALEFWEDLAGGKSARNEP